jgi:uncharacterized phiE125 gp8 family phage protein
MSLILSAAPAATPVSVAEVMAHMRVEDAAEVNLISGYLDAAVGYLDGVDGVLGRALVTQTWILTLDAFPASAEDALELPLPPLQSVTSITYVDTDGVTQTWSSALYDEVPTEKRGFVKPAYGEEWPTVRDQTAAVTVTFVAGYGAAAAVKAPIKQAIQLLCSHFYEHREPVLVGATFAALPLSVKSLLRRYRIQTEF